MAHEEPEPRNVWEWLFPKGDWGWRGPVYFWLGGILLFLIVLLFDSASGGNEYHSDDVPDYVIYRSEDLSPGERRGIEAFEDRRSIGVAVPDDDDAPNVVIFDEKDLTPGEKRYIDKFEKKHGL